MRRFNTFAVLALLLTFSFISCDKDDPVIVDEEEVITTLNYTLTPSDGSSSIILTFKDLDGEDGNDPVISGGTLKMNETYSGSIELLNESENPVENITEEIESETLTHQFFFQTTISGLSIDYNDQDSDGNPIGLSSTLQTVGIGDGTITIILRHEPNKSGTNVSSGDITNAGGETDIEVSFPISVQ